jgi:hypothetical protein
MLLRLEEQEVILHSSTCGSKEPAGEACELSFLHHRSYNQRLLPFVPRNHSSYPSLELHQINGQAYPYVGAVDSLDLLLRGSLKEARGLGQQVRLSLPDYVQEIVPHLLYRPFSHQLQPFFTPTALRVRWVWIVRSIALLHPFINLGHWLLYP